MSLTGGQGAAVDQLRAIERIDPTAVEIVDVREPAADGQAARVDLSLDCRGIEHRPGGLHLRERERFLILIDADFPFEHPSVIVPHRRWAGKPHVQWGILLCLYAAPAVEWQPGDGMFGFIERLWTWLNKAAVAELDPDDAPLHPPVAYTSGLDEVPTIIPRADTPEVTDEPWIGGVELEKVSSSRIDLVRWKPDLTSWLEGAAPAILLPSTLDFEYPSTVAALLDALAERGVPRERVLTVLKLAALGLKQDEPLIVVVGTAMRGTATHRRQHLAAWYVKPVIACGLGRSLHIAAEDSELRESAQRLNEIIEEWAVNAEIDWCRLREDRPEVTRRRDTGSPMRWFAGKAVSVWGCGALGAPIAEWLARAGARKLTLYDKASVAPGLLVRQPFTDSDIGRNKARVVAERLEAIRPRDLEVVVQARNVLRTALEQEDWHDGSDVVIDATASHVVAIKLERARRLHPQDADLISMIVGHTAEHALAAVARRSYSGATADVGRQIKLVCGRRGELSGFLAEFWPDSPRAETFQPEPGCSDPTFTGSGTDVAALAATMLSRAAEDLGGSDATSGIGHLATIAADQDGTRQVRLVFSPARRMPGGEPDAEVRLTPAAEAAMTGWIARSARELGPTTETGGLLFGERDSASGVIWIDEVIGPPPDSRCSPEEFVCGTEGVDRYRAEKEQRGRGSLRYLGVWHTHPTQDPMVSARDLQEGSRLLLDAASSPVARALLVIVGHTVPGPPALAAFALERSELEKSNIDRISVSEPAPLTPPPKPQATIGLALSGGGSRAMAFHLGCLRTLHDRGILERAGVISAVSGGSLITALWAYGEEDFDTFDARVQAVLRRGLQGAVARRTLLSRRTAPQVATRLLAGGSAFAARAASAIVRRGGDGRPIAPPLRRWVTRTDAFADVIDREISVGRRVDAPRRPGLEVVINATDLRTGSAFRFGSRESATWRFGKLPDNDVPLATQSRPRPPTRCSCPHSTASGLSSVAMAAATTSASCSPTAGSSTTSARRVSSPAARVPTATTSSPSTTSLPVTPVAACSIPSSPMAGCRG